MTAARTAFVVEFRTWAFGATARFESHGSVYAETGSAVDTPGVGSYTARAVAAFAYLFLRVEAQWEVVALAAGAIGRALSTGGQFAARGAVEGALYSGASQITEDQSPGRRVHDPKHPQADAEGYVTYSNVNAVEEMVNMISASRSYQNNIEVMNTARSLLLKTLQMGQG